MISLRYEVVDVFTDRPFTGNPLAVVFGAEALAGEQLQALAREFNLSETIFILPATEAGARAGATYRARIFTPATELPFAGHPTVGGAVTALRRGLFEGDTAVQECGAGLVSIALLDSGSARVTGAGPTLGPPVDPGPLLAAAGLAAGDFAGSAPRLAGCGLEWMFLPVGEAAVGRAAVPQASVVPKLTVFSWDAGARLAHVRCFAPGSGVPEDPATGSSALGLGVWLAAAGLVPGDGTTVYTIHQGAELHRPSTLECTVAVSAGTAVSVTVAGHVVPIASGEIAVPPFVG